jgi:alpha-beta hydrolase superfamily lysophospholipase
VLVDLVQTTTRDGVRLDGAFQPPASPNPSPLPVDACCLVHGTGGSFYSSTLLDHLAGHLGRLGCAALRVNTRGHDGVSTAATARGGRRQGAAYEVVDDCRHDLAAWVAWLRERAGPRVVLVGHSLGAVKCLYAMAHEPQLGAAGVVALSPPRLSYSLFCASPQGPEFLETYAQAEQHVRDGRPAALLDVKLPLPFLITAAGYVEKYGPDERYNYLRLLGGVACPVLVTLGGVEVENNMAFRGAPEALAELAARHRQIRVQVIAGADHFYGETKPELAAAVEAWLRSMAR